MTNKTNENTMEKRRQGNSYLYVAPIGMGTIQFSQGVGFVGWNRIGTKEVVEFCNENDGIY